MKESVNWKINQQKLFSIFKRERKALKKNPQSLIDSIKSYNIWVIHTPKGEGRKG